MTGRSCCSDWSSNEHHDDVTRIRHGEAGSDRRRDGLGDRGRRRATAAAEPGSPTRIARRWSPRPSAPIAVRTCLTCPTSGGRLPRLWCGFGSHDPCNGSQTLDVRLHTGDGPGRGTIVFVHGGGFTGGDKSDPTGLSGPILAQLDGVGTSCRSTTGRTGDLAPGRPRSTTSRRRSPGSEGTA